MKRGIVVFLENKPNLVIQFGCLYTSFKYVQSQDTDLVVFGTKEALKKVPDDCVKIEHRAVSYDPEWHNYHYINSMECIASENSGILDKYDLLLRSDVDTFITPAWNTYYPEAYTTGRGGYVNDEDTKNRLNRIANILGVQHKGIHNIGSTHYGDAKLLREVCRLTVDVTRHIINNEFPANEFPNGEGAWPGWYKGVSLLYGTEIATNHLVDNLIVDYRMLDYGSTNKDSVMTHPHIHCWHTDDMFSKFYFLAGKYDHLTTDNLDLDIVRDYCLYMSLKSRQVFHG